MVNILTDEIENIEHIKTNDTSGKFRIPNKQAQADYTLIKTKQNRKGGIVYVKSATTNDEKIADTCVEIFQNSGIDKMINLLELKKETLSEIEILFERKGLIVNEETTKRDVEIIQKKKKIAYMQILKNKIEKSVKLEYSIDYKEFIDKTGIKTMQRVGTALEVLDKMQNKSFFEWNEERLDNNLEIYNDIVKIAVIPEIRLSLDKAVGGLTDLDGNKLYNSLSDFKNAPIKNKSQYIKKITFKLNPSYLSNILGLERDYSEPDRKERINFKSSYSFRLDTLLRSIEKIQNFQNFTNFTFQTLQKKFGTQYKLYKHFKSRVLEPAIDDINKFTDLNVKMIETRDNQKSDIKHIRFIISRKANMYIEESKYGINIAAYYIASRLFYFEKNGIKNLLAFAKKIEKDIKSTLDIAVYGDKTVEHWKLEAKQAYQVESDLIKIIDVNKLFVAQNNLKYDDKRMCLVMVEDMNEDDEKKENIRILKYKDKRVTNPMESVEYLKDLLSTGYTERVDIFEFIPFKYIRSLNSEWININSMIDYQRNEDKIIEAINGKKLDHFRFINETTAEIFYKHVYRGSFKQLDTKVNELLRKHNFDI